MDGRICWLYRPDRNLLCSRQTLLSDFPRRENWAEMSCAWLTVVQIRLCIIWLFTSLSVCFAFCRYRLFSVVIPSLSSSVSAVRRLTCCGRPSSSWRPSQSYVCIYWCIYWLLFIIRIVVTIHKFVRFQLTILTFCFVFTARCTLVQSAVLRSHVVCLSVRLSVCDVGGLWSHRLEFFENNFTVS